MPRALAEPAYLSVVFVLILVLVGRCGSVLRHEAQRPAAAGEAVEDVPAKGCDRCRVVQ